jgi:hypothetical protein
LEVVVLVTAVVVGGESTEEINGDAAELSLLLVTVPRLRFRSARLVLEGLLMLPLPEVEDEDDVRYLLVLVAAQAIPLTVCVVVLQWKRDNNDAFRPAPRRRNITILC